jgi:hypothetical protein
MKRITCVVAALGLVLAACGSSDEEPAANSSGDDPIEASADETTDEEPAGEPSDDAPADEEPAANDDTGDDPASDDSSASDDDGNVVSSGGAINSINDIPQVCRDAMADFLREVEPIVSTIDWQTATIADFEAIAADFEAVSDEFDNSFDSRGCEDLEFSGDNEFELMIDFARSEAPGTVSFLEFLNVLGTGVSSTGDAGDDGSASGGELATCDDATAFVESLLENYDNYTQVPAAEFLQLSQITSLFITCTPEQLEFLTGDAFNDFFED